MSVTLEQALALHHKSHMPLGWLTPLLRASRARGVRRDNVGKNVGKRAYAFNKIQARTLPTLFRPPKGTYGSSVTT